MNLTTESRRVRWTGLLITWAILATLILVHAVAFRAYVDRLNHLGLRGAAVAPTPLKRICPTMYADVQMWVRHALALANGAGPQLRYTYADNAPYGREVHWDSGFAWMIVGAGELRHLFTGEPFPTAVERSLAWINAPLLLAFVAIFSAWTSRRAGLGAGVLLAFGMVGHPDFYSGFGPNYVDHHGVLAASVLGLFLGGLFMGGGFWRGEKSPARLLPGREIARSGAIFSAILGAYGMWVSAATLIPAIAIMGVAGALAILVYGGRAQVNDTTLEPGLWRLWGRVGAVLCVAFYLLEYAPFHLGLRLEVNNPVYALGWWGGSEIVALLAEWRRAPRRGFKVPAGRVLAAVAALLVAPVIILIGREKVFVVSDPFVARLNAKYVAEALSFAASLRYFGNERVWVELPWVAAVVILTVVLWWRSRAADRPLILFATLAFVASAGMGLDKIRFLPSASGPELGLILLGVIGLVTGCRRWVRWTWVAGLVALVCVPPIVSRIRLQVAVNRHHGVQADDALQPFYRDVAAALRRSQPKGDIVLLASPNASVAIGYYGEFKTIGTLYWENLAGTKAAAEMFSAQSEQEARRLIRARGVTHIAMIENNNFLAEYFDLLHPHPHGESLQNSFGYQLLIKEQIPIWLERIPYSPPPDLPIKIARVLLFKTRFGPPRAESDYEAAVHDLDHGRIARGEKELDAAIAIDPKSAEYWMIKGHVLLSRGDVAGALAAENRAVDNAAPIQRPSVCLDEGNRFYEQHAPAAAVALYRRGLGFEFNLQTANNLAWVLATSRDARVRNGPEALRLSQRIVRDRNDYTYLSAYAAALAECKQFPDAVKVETRLLNAVRAARNPALIASSEARLTAYRAGKPWRQ